jgi:hypothetical protein
MRALTHWIGFVFLLSGVMVSAVFCQTSNLVPPSPVAPNGSLIKATVLKYSIWNSTLLIPSHLAPTQLYSLMLSVHTADPSSPDLPSFVKAKDSIETFTLDKLPTELFGKSIHATVRLIGDEYGQRFWIQNIRTDESP